MLKSAHIYGSICEWVRVIDANIGSIVGYVVESIAVICAFPLCGAAFWRNVIFAQYETVYILSNV